MSYILFSLYTNSTYWCKPLKFQVYFSIRKRTLVMARVLYSRIIYSYNLPLDSFSVYLLKALHIESCLVLSVYFIIFLGRHEVISIFQMEVMVQNTDSFMPTVTAELYFLVSAAGMPVTPTFITVSTLYLTDCILGSDKVQLNYYMLIFFK